MCYNWREVYLQRGTSMKGGIAVSVLVPVYNTADTLARCLRSLADQTLRNIEII